MIGLMEKPQVEVIATFKPLPWQFEPWRDISPVVLFTGSAGGGKSRLAAEKLHGFCKRYPGATALMLRKTRESMTNSTVLFLERIVMGDDPQVIHRRQMHRFEYANGSILAYGGMADDKQRQQIRSIGQDGSVDIVWMEEANAFDEDDYNELLARMRGKAAPWLQIIISTNPDAPDHWINRRLIKGGEAKVYFSKADDNTYNPPEYRSNLQKLSGVLKKRLAEGHWVAAEGMFFTEWDEEKHICDPFIVPASWTRWTATDYGFADPFCTLWFARNPANKYHIYIYREAYRSGLRDEEQAQAIVRASKEERIAISVGDPSMFNNRQEQGKPSIAWVYWQNGVKLRPGMNDRISGWQTVRRSMAWNEEPFYNEATGLYEDRAAPRLQIMRDRAPNLVRTIPSMVHDPLDSEDLADKLKSVKTEDHPVDTLRYGLVLESMPEQQIGRLLEFQVAA